MNHFHRLMGYGGLIPFITLALFFHYPDDLLQQLLGVSSSAIAMWLVSYAALIYSFIGGIYWAVSLNSYLRQPLVLLSILMMLWAWLWILLAQVVPFWLMALSFWLLPIIEAKWLKEDLAEDFRKMRMHLSLVAGLSLITMHF